MALSISDGDFGFELMFLGFLGFAVGMGHEFFATLEDIIFDLGEPFVSVCQDKWKDVVLDGVKFSFWLIFFKQGVVDFIEFRDVALM